MKREIKFRAWNNQEEKMYNWRELLFSNDRWNLFSAFGNEFHPTAPPKYFWELMQYIGIKDKHGKNVYENDIVLYPVYGTGKFLDKFVVTFARGTFLLDAISGCYGGVTFNYTNFDVNNICKNLEVIGNTYENPELLNKNGN